MNGFSRATYHIKKVISNMYCGGEEKKKNEKKKIDSMPCNKIEASKDPAL